MNRDHFNPTIIVLTRSIANAASKEELYVISQQIEQTQEDFKLFRSMSIQLELDDLRDQLQERLREIDRDSKNGIDTQCGTLYPS